MAINNITDLKEQVLDKPDSKLSAKEIKTLNSVDKKTYDSMKDAIATQKFELKDNKGVNCNVHLKDILQNFDPINNTFKIQSHEFQVGTKTELSAWIQLYLITHGKSVYNDKQGDPTTKLGIDGRIGEHTKSAINDLKLENKIDNQKTIIEQKNTVQGSLSFAEIPEYSFKDDFAKLFGQKVADMYEKNYDLFNDDGTLQAPYYKGRPSITVYYNSPLDLRNSRQSFFSISNKDVAESPTNPKINIVKFLTSVKNQIDTQESTLKMKPLLDSLDSAKDNMKVEKFSSLIKTYLDAQNWVTNGELDLKDGIGTGLEIKGQNLSVTFPGGKENLVPINNLQTAEKFDEKKLIVELTKILKPKAEAWRNSLN